MKYKLNRVYLGGTGEMYSLDIDGVSYLYKPSLRKGTNIIEPFRGLVQQCAYEVQKIVDPESAVYCYYTESDGLIGAVQERINVSSSGRDYREVQFYDEDLFPDEVNQFLREYVSDYLLCNFDGHGGNFVTDENGVIRGVDKEQSFRYLNDPLSRKPNVDYSPNTEFYGELEPIYNLIFRRYSRGKLDVDFSVLDKYMSRVEKFSNDEYRKIFKPYCDSCCSFFGGDSESMLDKIVERKINMRSNIEEFYSQLTSARNMKDRRY